MKTKKQTIEPSKYFVGDIFKRNDDSRSWVIIVSIGQLEDGRLVYELSKYDRTKTVRCTGDSLLDTVRELSCAGGLSLLAYGDLVRQRQGNTEMCIVIDVCNPDEACSTYTIRGLVSENVYRGLRVFELDRLPLSFRLCRESEEFVSM